MIWLRVGPLGRPEGGTSRGERGGGELRQGVMERSYEWRKTAGMQRDEGLHRRETEEDLLKKRKEM